MVKINLLCVGKVKESYFSAGILEYQKRITRFADFKIIEVAEENFKDPSVSEIEIIKEKEADRLLPQLKGYIFAMAIEGTKCSSERFSERLKKLSSLGNSVFTFVIGGSYGLSERVKKRADELLSFSDMTFPHTLFRLLLTEQIYRAICIGEGVRYHK